MLKSVVRAFAWRTIPAFIGVLLLTAVPLRSQLSPVPAAPTGLAAADQASLSTGHRVWLAWDLPRNDEQLTGYLLESGSAPGRTDIATLLRSSLEPSFTTPDPPAGTYYLRVRAVRGAAISPASNEVRLVVRPPSYYSPNASAPPLDRRIAMRGSLATFSWNGQLGSPPSTGYVVEAGSWPGMSDLGTIVTSDTSVTVAVSDVQAGVYHLNVDSRNDSGVTRWTLPLGVIATPGCSFVLGNTLTDGSGRPFVSPFNYLSYTVSASGPDCPWTAETDRPWLWFSEAISDVRRAQVSGTGSGFLSLQYEFNHFPARAGVIKFRAAGYELPLFVIQFRTIG